LTKIKIIKYVYEYIIILFFSVIIESGLSISLGIDTCIKNSNMKIIKKEFMSMDSKIIKGMRIADAFENSDILSKSTKSMIKIGEEAGNLDTIINKLEVRLSSNLEKQINNFIKRLQPITICIMAIIVCVFIVIFILPIFDAMYIKV
ncbi:MAG: hypothetical protein GX275_11200, partial [Clostridiales bacterium]|nr:hypothetical protein [Clostridiales bacterium]